MATRWLGRLLVALLAPALSGCIYLTGEFGSPIRVDNLSRIETGRTTRSEIVAWFGPPSAFFSPSLIDVITDDLDDAEFATPLLDDVYTWRWVENDSRIFFIPIFFATIDAAATIETLTVFFDDQGLVQYHAYRRDEARP